MRIVVTAAGSRGDVQPCVALGLGLQRAGHEVTLASWKPYRRMAESRGLAFRPVAGPAPDSLMAALVGAGRNPLKYARRFRPLLRPHVEGGLRDCLAACAEADAVLYTPLGFAGFMAAEHLGLPSVGSMVEPLFVRSAAYPSAVLGRPVKPPVLGGPYNLLSHRAVEQLYWRIIEPLVAEARGKVGLPSMPTIRSPLAEIHRRRRPLLLGWSRHVLPADPRTEDRMPTTGYWFLDHERGWEPPEKLRRFLEAGEPPVALGLGSMTGVGAAETDLIVSGTAEALGRTGLRGVLLSESAGLDDLLPENVIRVSGEVPYDWLFPRVAAAVHHGGAGTVAVALRSGLPSVVVPVLPDQAFWAHRVHSLGAAPPPIPQKGLTAENLSAAILRAVTDHRMRSRCEALAAQIGVEYGVIRAVEAFERHAGQIP
ncbi:MAG TPA: glycosyltransferase [Rubrobacter sp.]|nr:glycosyltransferase [Rubrobacter sp.]